MLKKIQFLYLLLFISINLSAQMRVRLEDRHSIDSYFTYYRGVTPVESVNEEGETEYSSFRESLISDFIRVGATYSFAIVDKLYFFTGVGFSNPQHTKAKQTKFKLLNIDYRRRMLEIPVGVRWVFSNKRCKSYISGEYIHQIYMSSKTSAKQREVVEEIDNAQSRFNVGIGAEFRPLERLGVFSQFNGSIKNPQNSTGEWQNNFSVGISIGTRIYI